MSCHRSGFGASRTGGGTTATGVGATAQPPPAPERVVRPPPRASFALTAFHSSSSPSTRARRALQRVLRMPGWWRAPRPGSRPVSRVSTAGAGSVRKRERQRVRRRSPASTWRATQPATPGNSSTAVESLDGIGVRGTSRGRRIDRLPERHSTGGNRKSPAIAGRAASAASADRPSAALRAATRQRPKHVEPALPSCVWRAALARAPKPNLRRMGAGDGLRKDAVASGTACAHGLRRPESRFANGALRGVRRNCDLGLFQAVSPEVQPWACDQPMTSCTSYRISAEKMTASSAGLQPASFLRKMTVTVRDRLPDRLDIAERVPSSRRSTANARAARR